MVGLINLLRKTKPQSAAAPDIPAEIDGVRVKYNARAKRLSLRVDLHENDVILVWPKRGTLKAATKFVADSRDWIDSHREKIKKTLESAERLRPGGRVMVNGVDYTLEHRAGRGLTRVEGDRIVVFGGAAHFNRRLEDFLKAEALKLLQTKTDALARQLNLRPRPVRVLDPKTRWGSCHPDGHIMYSWRIIMAPPAVIDYLVAHETAHRIHADHSKAFWRLCYILCTGGPAARRWLKQDGQKLMAL